MTADNRVFDVNGESLAELEACLDLALLLEEDVGFLGFRIDPDQGVVLYTRVSDRTIPFITAQGAKATADLVFNWLQLTSYELYEKPGTHDGDNEKGWVAHMEFWGGVKGDSTATVSIRPTWLWLGR
jgi:hypothetical protein